VCAERIQRRSGVNSARDISADGTIFNQMFRERRTVRTTGGSDQDHSRQLSTDPQPALQVINHLVARPEFCI